MSASREMPSVVRLKRHGLYPLAARVLVLTLLSWSLPFDTALPPRTSARAEAASLTAQAAVDTLYVNGDAATACGGKSPCFASIQGAIDAVTAGQRIEIQAGTYAERLRVWRKNARAAATEADRIVIEADPAAPAGSVVLRGREARCESGYAIEIGRSKYLTVRGLTVVGAGGRGVGLRGGSLENTGIHLERNRIARGGSRECNGGIDVGRGNPGTVIANNLIHGNGRNGIRFRDGRGGTYHVFGNTIVGNAWSGVQIAHAVALELIDNLIVGNGNAPGPASARAGVRRLRTSPAPASLVRLRGNLVCGNDGGELSGPILDATDAANLTPTGSEGPGVAASAGCGDLAVLFRDVDGADDERDTADDDFRLAAGAPAIDAGVDPRLLGLSVPDDVLESDFDGPERRPRDGDGDDTAAFDAGAHESAGDAQPTPTRTSTPTPSPSPTPGVSASPTPTPVSTATPTPTPTPSPSPSPTPTATASPAPTPSPGPTLSQSPAPTTTPSPAPTPEPSPSPGPTPTIVVATASPAPTPTPTAPPTASPAPTAIPSPTESPRPGNGAPVARGNAYSLRADETLTVAAPGVLGNDTDPDRDPLFGVKLSDPVRGDVAFAADGSFTYTPDPSSLVCPEASAGTGIAFVQSRSTPLSFTNDGSAVNGLAKGDFDHDGNVDLALGGSGNIPGVGNGGFVATMRGNGDGTFAAPVVLLGLGSEAPAGALAKDFDGDGELDLLFAVSSSSRLLLFAGQGNGSFAAPVTITVSHPDGVQAADVNGDEIVDLVTFASADSRVSVLLGNGDGTFGAPTTYPVGSGPQDLAIGDLNGDRAPDLVVGIVNATELDVLLNKNDGTGAFDPARAFNPGMQVRGLYLGDFDDDHDLDVVASGAGCPQGFPPTTLNNGNGCMVFLPGAGDGTFAAPRPQDYVGLEGDFPGRLFSENVTPDLDADGRPDVVFLGGPLGAGNYVFAALGNGQGGFAMTRYVMSRGPAPAPGPQLAGSGVQVDRVHAYAIVVDDFDGDGVADIATGDVGITRPGGVSLLLGTTPGQFAAPRSSSLPEDGLDLNNRFGATGAIALGDFTHGGPLELAVVASGVFTVGELRVVTVQDDGSMTSPTSVVSDGAFSEFHARFARSADFDRDGNLDVVYLGLGGGPAPRVLIRYGDGAGHLTTAATLPYGSSNLWNVVADDFDGDGFPDLAVYNGPFGGVASVDVHRSNGTGRGFTFVGTAGGGNLGPAAFTSLGDLGKAAMVAADFDRDGFVDLAVSRGVDGASGGNPQKSFFLKGHGDGTFSPAVVVGGVTSNGGGISDFAAADLDHDGKLDLIGSSFGFVSVQRGNGDGTFVPLVEYGSSTGGITQMAVADFDRDGHQDVAVVGDNVPYGLSILPGKGDGTLDVAATRKIAVGEIRTVGIAAGDVNGDGKTDLVVEHDGQHINHFTVLLNAAEPSFGCSLTDRFLYRADDGSDASNTTTVELRIAPVDHAPLITSVPVTTALVAQPFTYAVTAFDQDAGDVLAFALVTAPTGMSIDPDGGLVRWVPAASQSGPTSVTVRVYDSAGMFAEQTFPVTVRASVLVPDVVGQTQAAAESALGGAGLTVGTVGTRSSATVPAGSVISQSPLAGSKVVEGTAVSLVVSSGPPAPGEELASIVVRPATDALLIGGTRAFSALAVLGNGSTSDVTNSVAWTSSAPGVATVDASGLASGVGVGSTAIGATLDGVAGSATLEVRAADPGDTSAPLAVITSPTDGGEVTSAVDVVGSATDPSFLRYELASSPAGDDAFTLLATGTSPVVAGVLGRLDPTVLLNGLYELRLRVYDRGGNVAEAIVSVRVTRDQKIGLFSITLQDLNVALSGLPITIERTYDSRDKALGDFGFGWTLQVKTLRLRTNREQGSGWVVSQPTALSYQLAPTVPHYATLTLADGKVETFDLAISPTSSAIVPFTTVTAGYVPRAGTRGSLTVLDNPNLLIVDPQPGEVVLVDDVTLNTFDPKRFRYTSAEGQTFDIDRRKGVERVEDRNGNTLTIGPGGIVHSSGRTVALTRDVQGRITQITDPKGNVRSYAYDARGDLIGATDFVGNVARYAYDGRHGLIDIKDPLGNHVQRNEYDVDGRLIATIDAQGRRTVLTHALGASQEIVRDRLGNETVLEYDAAGNVVAKTDALGGRTESTFDARGNELTERDPLGRVATRTYDAFDNVLSSTDFDGNTTTTTYDLFQQVLTTTDPEGRTTTNGYDARGNLTSVTDPEGGVTQHTYDAAGNRLSTTDPIGRVTTFTYDGFGNLTSTTDPRGVVTADTHDANGRVLTSTKDGLQTRFEWDAAQRVTRTIDPLGHETTRTYSAVGDGTLPATTTDPTGRVTTSTYDERGNLLLRTFPGGTTEIQTYDAENRLASTTDRDGNTTSYAYDALGRQTKVTNPDGTSTATTYDAAGRVLSRTDERGNVTTYVHSANQQTVTDALGHATVNRFDGRGRLIERTDALGRTTEWTFDSRGNVVVTLAADGVASTTTYDLAHQRTAETDRAGRTTQFAYDLGGNLMRVTDAAGQVTEFTYDARGNRLTQTDANGHTTTMTYDGADRLATRTRPLGQQESFTYDAAGREITRTDFNGEATELVYDAAGRLQEKRLSDGSSIPFAFSGAGRRTAAGGDAYVYDVRGRLLEEHKASGDVLAYTYDAAGNKLTSTTSQGTTTDTYDVLNRLASVSDATGATTYGYDAVGNLARTTYPNGNVTTYGYDDLNRLTSLTNAGPGGVLASYTYTLGLAGNRTAVAEAGPATTGRSVGYGYDAVYRLTAETIDAPGTADDLTIAYTYDEVGNRLTMDRGGVVTTSTYDANDRLVTETTGGSTRTSTYDDNGNLIARTQGAVSESYTYDLQGRLAAADGPSGPVSYAYDADGLRIARTAGGATTTYLVDKRLPHGQVVVEKSGATTATYAYGHQRVSQTRGGEGTHFYLYDGQLSTRYLTNTSGAVSDGYTFDAFGVQLGASGGTTNAFRYVGEQLDPNVGFYYLRARYYDQANGRFVATDPLQGNAFEPMSLHRYLYVNADPVQHVDPRGEALLVNLLVFTTIVAILASYWIPALIKARVEALTVLAVGLNSIAQGRNALAEALDEAKGATTVDRVHSALALLTAKTKSYPSLVFKQSVVTPPLGKGAAQYAILAVDQKTSTPLAIMVFDYDGSGGDAVHRYPRWYSEHSDWLVGDNKD